MLKKVWFALLYVLAANAFAAVDLNKADQAQLESVKGIGPAMSARILDERKKGDFKDWNDFMVRVKGVGPANAAKFSESGMTVNGAALPQAAAPATAAKPATKP
ncbi:ComEA family DNA-binding protein [Caldimonas tepidiphila]|uniref:ComEA family DNA-binding protein n=1 Tax=Caldimonas tepidiphila TaxID=2315841 RepID=UPI000E5B2450|nr:helix-hairpin-helix domain-containing protein [Caldimonas tepidiphila]